MMAASPAVRRLHTTASSQGLAAVSFVERSFSYGTLSLVGGGHRSLAGGRLTIPSAAYADAATTARISNLVTYSGKLTSANIDGSPTKPIVVSHPSSVPLGDENHHP
jgi:hypothetical protein